MNLVLLRYKNSKVFKTTFHHLFWKITGWGVFRTCSSRTSSEKGIQNCICLVSSSSPSPALSLSCFNFCAPGLPLFFVLGYCCRMRGCGHKPGTSVPWWHRQFCICSRNIQKIKEESCFIHVVKNIILKS